MNNSYKYILALTAFLVPNYFYATQWTVSNDPIRPAQFLNLPEAVDAASNGDTILIAGSSTSYSTPSGFKITKKVLLIGEGVNNPDGLNTVISGSTFTFGRLNLNESSDFSKVIGINFTNFIDIDGNFTGSSANQRVINNIEFIGCRFSLSVDFNNTYNNCSFVNCLFFSSLDLSGVPSNFSVVNSIFSNAGFFSGTAFNVANQVEVVNSIFMNRTSNCFSNINGIKVENCIFYKAEPTGTNSSIFNNNLTFLCNNNALPPAGTGNTGTGNVVNQNPLFISYPLLGEAFSWSHNYGLQAGSPAINAGTGGTDIGLTGGAYGLNQLKGNSPLPVVTSLSLPNSSVPINGTLQGNIKAKVRN